MTFYHHGRKGSSPLTLYFSSVAMKKAWIDQIAEQQQEYSTKRRVFIMKTLLKQHFRVTNRVNSTVTQSNASSQRHTERETDMDNKIDGGPS